jgi:hypothetical protein
MIHKPVLAIESTLRKIPPTAVTPALVTLGPQPTHNPTGESGEELADVSLTPPARGAHGIVTAQLSVP